MLSTGTPVPSLKRQLRSTANAARKQRKRHAGGASLNRRKPIAYALIICLRYHIAPCIVSKHTSL